MGFDLHTARMIQANEANWNARTPIHVASDFYSVTTRDPADWFADYEWTDLGDLHNRDLAHLQCHIGSETLAFAHRGARVTGLDLSGASIEAAKAIAAARNLDIDYVQSDVYTAVDALGHNRFDVVYTGKGSICFLPDLTPWADQVAALLKPGGFLYLVEFHPLLHSLGRVPDAETSLILKHDYLAGRGPAREDGTYTYTDGPTVPSSPEYFEWCHGIGEVVTALIGAGLRIDLLRESEEIPWQRWASMENTRGVWHRLPREAPRTPLLYAIRATKS
ncbi:bifunctional 2-polyprenyl-6-hydroxyphenol methylase/3-demethylubiquinol 3-O-methyltransferase UbiG [Alloactinosynnema sp. L-07]|uniref:class I SAM-dependent methyltransferase n=1 Tax=Alloactinosynnema sp. L-07 TaxID=1653480 RepID=UPI0006B482CC|nr:class I SAM-dependent methyltransferase [Alloactinosynnema sp. L-07]